MDTIKKLAQCDLGHETYHSDADGHIQVEYVSTCGFETPSVLLERIDQAFQWPEFFAMAKTKPEEWLLDLVKHFPITKPYSTKCFVDFLDILSSRDAVICLVQESPRWLWDKQNISLMSKVIDAVAKLIDSSSTTSLDGEIDLILLNGILEKLGDIKKSHQSKTSDVTAVIF